MKIRTLIPMSAVILVMVCVCVTVCCAAQAAAKYVADQEHKNTLIASVGENVDVLRSCLSPCSRLSKDGTPLSIDPNKVSEIVDSIKSSGK